MTKAFNFPGAAEEDMLLGLTPTEDEDGEMVRGGQGRSAPGPSDEVSLKVNQQEQMDFQSDIYLNKIIIMIIFICIAL